MGGDKDSLAAAYNNLAISASQHGLQDAARTSFERALVLRKETGNVNGICACSTNLANLRNRTRQLRCSRCRRSFYCSPDCQRGAWRQHSPTCQTPTQAPHVAREAEIRSRSCVICLEGLKLLDETRGDEKVTILECLHCLHTVCWTGCTETGRDDCPVCRNNLGFSR